MQPVDSVGDEVGIFPGSHWSAPLTNLMQVLEQHAGLHKGPRCALRCVQHERLELALVPLHHAGLRERLLVCELGSTAFFTVRGTAGAAPYLAVVVERDAGLRELVGMNAPST